MAYYRELILQGSEDPSLKRPVLNGGFVRLVDVFGDDQRIIDAARVSYQKGTKRISDDQTLINYLMRKHHTTPFEMAEVLFHVRVPMDTWRQWIRHRTASVNEYSTRYSEAIDEKQTTKPGEWRLQSTTNKQGSGGFLPERGPTSLSIDGQLLSDRETDFHIQATNVYKERLKAGVAREQARKDLPLSTYTEAYWKIDLHNCLHFLSKRLEPDVQLEIRSYANAVAHYVADLFPMTWAAFVEYRLHAITLSVKEQRLIGRMIRGFSYSSTSMENKREQEELTQKLYVMLNIADVSEGR